MDHSATELAQAPPGTDDYVAYGRHGSADCLERALLACAQAAFSQARRILGNAADAEDAVQEAFLQLARTAHRYDGQVPFPAWVGRLVRDACMRVRRSDRRRQQRERIAMSGAPVVHHDQDPELSADIHQAMARLSAADRAVIELHYFAGLSQAHTAAALKTSENAVALRLSRARKRLRDVLTAKGVAVSAATIASILATQSLHAATPAVLAGASTLAASVAAGAPLPTTLIPLSLTQKGLLFMSLHPIASAICAGLITLLCSLPLFSWAGEVAPPVAAPVVRTTTPPAADQPWGGAAKDLLPFIDPHAAYSAAIDWEYLLRNGATTKPTSLLADPRVAPVVALIREQLRLWANTKSEVPDLGSLLASADGCILGVVNRPTKAVNESSVLPIFVASISEDVTRDMKERIEKANILSRNKAKNVKIGAFSGMQWRPNVSLLFHGKKVFYGSEEALSEALTRPIPRLDPKLLAVPAWCTFDVTNYLREVAQADHDHSDPLNMAFWFGPNWRTSTPRFAATLAPGPAGWRSTVTISGISDLPLRRPSSAFAGCVPPRALASLMLGVDVSRAGPFTAALLTQILGQRTVESFSKLLADVGLSPDILRSALSGDFSCIVQPQAPLPAVTLVIGITPTVNADLLSPAMSAFGLTSLVPPANARAAWSGALPFGMIQVLLAQDRLVISSGDGEPFLKKFAQTIVNDEVTLDIDIPSLARLYLPLLYAQMPQRPVFFSGTPLWAWLFYLVHSQINLTDKNAHLPINMESDDGFRFPQEYWRKMVGDSTLTMNQCLALYDTVDQAGGQSRRKYVYRLADGWRLRGNSMADLINATILDKKSLDRQLEGLVLIAGTPYEALAPLPIGKQPCFDRQWLPAIAAVIEHLPLQHLSLRCVSGGITLYEDGTPCLGVIVSSLPAVLANIPAANSVASAIQVRDGEKMRVDHTVALNALHKALAHLQSRSPEDPPYLTPGEMLAGAGIDLADLSSLNGGKAPTATSINSLGFWHPHAWPHNNCEWLVPIGKGWFMEMAWWANTGAIITTLPRIEQRQWSEQEINAVMLKWKEVHLPSVKADEPAETPAPKPQAVNDF